jgi:hypothetical protein
LNDTTVATICDFVGETVGKQRAERAVDQPGGQGFAFGRPALAAEKAAGNPTRGVSCAPGNRPASAENRGSASVSRAATMVTSTTVSAIFTMHRAAGLPGDFAGLER